jgi:myo-inositol 2-dehydrogenase / D-chiro-inositol 1-dehydrogenase
LLVTNDEAGLRAEPVRTRRVGVLGCGRIGRLHAALLAGEVPGLEVVAVADVAPAAAATVSRASGAEVRSIAAVLESTDVDAVAVCTSTDTHVDLVVAAAEAGKAIFCEKPVSLDLAEVDRALSAVERAGVPFMIGFNRRFDPGHRSVHDAVRARAIGDLHTLRITSRDPEPPPLGYVASSGGLFLDMTIHDFDMARHVVGSEVVEVFARGAVRVDPRIGEAGDVDTAVVVLTHADGTMTTIENSRRAVYGYDQRLEAFGSGGMAASDNPARHAGWTRTAEATTAEPLPWFFLERYRESYRQEWIAFQRYLSVGGPSPAGVDAARQSLAIGLAATLSMRERRPVRVDEIGRSTRDAVSAGVSA